MMHKLSIVVPFLNEEENLEALYKNITGALRPAGFDYEIIFVDDGSRDKGPQIIADLARQDQKVKLIRFRKNFGQTAAIAAGIKYSSGDVIVPIDADLQNDPADIPKLVAKLDEGYDVVSGWRKDRQDAFFSRKLPSWLANYLISKITKVKLHDYGCTLKAYNAEVIKDIPLYGEMHRFLPAYTAWYGARITEMPTTHYARKFGKSKYGISRTFRVVLDLLVVKFLSNYLTKPIHFFGGAGALTLFLGLLSGLAAIGLKIFAGRSFIDTPLPLLSAILGVIGIQFILMGLLGEIMIRTYHESQDKPTYIVKEKINI
jgi:glycosyltransferase involved in cell wall biosynthesis